MNDEEARIEEQEVASPANAEMETPASDSEETAACVPSETAEASAVEEVAETAEAPTVETATEKVAETVEAPAAEKAIEAVETPVAEAVAETAKTEESSEASDEAPVEEERTNPKWKWYVVHTYSGFEAKAKKALHDRIVTMKKEEAFGEVLIPSENVVEMIGGQKKTTSRKFFPGYIFVQMEMTEETWHVVKGTPKVTGFVGKGRTPPAVPEKEVLRITKQISDGTLAPKMKMTFDKGDSVRVVDGPFQNFNGIVDEVKPEKGKLRVLVSIFGRSTPVELDYVQVEKN